MRLRLENNVEAGQAVYPYAKILDGEFSGREARLGLISRSVPLTGCPGAYRPVLDPDYLAPIPDVKKGDAAAVLSKAGSDATDKNLKCRI